MQARDFREGDLRLLLELAQETIDGPQANTFGVIAFWAMRLPRTDWRARLWFEAGTLAGWGWLHDGGDLEWEVRSPGRELLDEILAWAQPSSSAARADDAAGLRRLQSHGLVARDGPWMRLNRRTLDEIEPPVVPDGYVLRTVEPSDYESRALVQRSAFTGSQFTLEAYAAMRAAWPYRGDLDCVVEAPDGSIAAYAQAWLDERNGMGEFEPVATHPDHRRRGLGRAVNLFALRRLRDLGAHTAQVWCRGDDDYPVPRRLYESVGFSDVVARTVGVAKLAEPS